MVWLQSTTKGNAAMVSDRFLSGHSSARADAQQDWNVVSATSSGARQIVTLQRAIDTKDQADYPFENKTQSFIWAFGMDPVQPTDQSPNFIPHSGANHGAFDYNALIPDPPAPAGNGTSADPAAGGSAVDAPPSPGRVLSDNTAVYIHAICMASAWGFLAYMGAFVARFLKTRLGKWWFPAHWGIMAMVAVLSIAGTVAMYLGRGFVALDSVHGIAGSVVLVVMLLQIILGIVIDRMYDSGRTSIPGRDKAHWVIGYTLAIGGPASVLLGLLEYEASSALIGTYVATWILFILLFAYGMHQLPKKKIDPIRKSTLPREDEIHFQSVPRPGQPHAGLGRTPSLSARRPAPSHLASSGEILPRRVSAKAPPLSAPTASWMGGPPPAPMRDSDVPLGSPSASAVGSTASSYSRTPPRPRRPADLSLPRRSVVNIDGQDASDGSYAGPVPWSPGGNPTSPTRDFPPRSPRNASLGARAPLSPRSGRSGGVGAFESGTVRSDASLRVAPRRAPSSRRSSSVRSVVPAAPVASIAHGCRVPTCRSDGAVPKRY
ncbi:hypothetical protein BC828DRAFT_4583 [Blastocladiella britannica]|nr:hypothetical protein BC828DRAFT_4583 [Blastocladiella britannica]